MKTYCFKLYQSNQNKHLHKEINLAGSIYNHLIALHKRYHRLYGKHLNANKLMKHITKLKKQERFAYWNQLGSQAIQDIAQRIERGYRLFFRNKKLGIKSAPPSFKKVRKYKSFTLKQAGYWLLEGNKIFILGRVYKYFKSRDIEGRVKTLTVKRNTLGEIFIYLTCEIEEAPVESRLGESIGLDFGLKRFLVASDETIIESPLFFKQGIKKIRKLNRILSRKRRASPKRVSNNYKKASKDLARAHKRIANKRKDYHFKLARELAKKYALICIEDLNIKAMQKVWGKKVSDLGYSQFVNILRYQSLKAGSRVIEIPRFYPSSKTCSNCGYILEDIPLDAREWACPKCSSIHDRDINAAVNILRVGTSTLVGEGVRPASAGIL